MFQRPFISPANALSTATTAGDLAGAYAALRRLNFTEAQSAALAAGFAIRPGNTPRAKAEFWLHIQDQIVQAVRLKTDGFGLQEHRKNAA